MKMPSQKEHVFSQVPQANIPRSVFSRSHCFKTTFSAGLLVPFYVDEALPGDTFSVKSTMFARILNTVAPVMDNMYLDYFFFAVPYRILWDNFKKFMGEQVNPGDSTSFTVPQTVSPAGGWLAETVYDYMGLPINVAGLSVNALPLRAYNRIYQDWFRSEDLQTSPVINTGNGADTSTDYALFRRCKRPDYFTSCLPYPQKGATAVSLPLGTQAPVVTNGHDITMNSAISHNEFMYGTAGTNIVFKGGATITAGPEKLSFGNESGLVTDLTTATASTINALRQAFQLQKLLERDARGGTRYREIVQSHFGVVSPDSRMMVPEYLGGGSSPINFQSVPQTSSTTGTYPQGHLAANGTVMGQGGFTKSFTEHCVIMGIMCARADITYQQGINRMWLRSTKYDFYWPALSNIGEQAVTNNEIYAVAVAAPGDAGDLQNKATFGYQERWAEYRYFPSIISGKLRSTYSQPLDVWHLAQNFGALPTLGTAFIQETPPMTRIKAISTEPDFLFDSYIEIRAARPMPTYSVPGLIDHF